MHNILLWGYWGGYNVGDELILRSELDLIGRDKVVVVVRGSVRYVEKLHNVEAVPFYKAASLVNRYKNMVGGGGLFQDKTSIRNLLYYMYPIVWGRVSFLLGVGIGPIRHPFSKLLIKNGIRSILLGVVRDKISYNFLKSLGKEFIWQAPDLTFMLNWDTPVQQNDTVILIPGPALGYYWHKIRKIIGKRKVIVIEFLPTIDKQWRYLYPSGWNVHDGPTLLLNNELIDLLTSTDHWIVGRLHGIILACMLGAKFYPVVYDLKMLLLLQDYCDNLFTSNGYVNISNTKVINIRNAARRIYSKVVNHILEEG